MTRKTVIAFETAALIAEVLPRTLVNPMRRLTPKHLHSAEVTAGIAKSLPYSLRFEVSVDMQVRTVEIAASVVCLYDFSDRNVGNISRLTLPFSMLGSDQKQFKTMVRAITRQTIARADFFLPAFGSISNEQEEEKMIRYFTEKTGISEEKVRETHPAIFGEW